jgi:lipid-A-disaccharide synthase
VRPCILLTAAEASGDALGAALMGALQARLDGDVRFIGIGGPAMTGKGLVSAFDISELSIVGLVDGLLAYRRADARARQLADLAAREQPDVAVLIDSWGFSYLAAKRLRRTLPGLPLVKYVAPQAWATRPGRAKALATAFDQLLSIIAFEAPLFERAGAKVTCVGHPALTGPQPVGNPARLRARMGVGPDDPILLVLPGSRPSEVARLAGPFGEAVRILTETRPSLRVVVAAAPTVADMVVDRISGWPAGTFMVVDEAGKADAMAGATAALACSGTVTTELAAAGCPMVVAYRLGPLTYQIAKRIVRTRYITLFNIAAGEAVAPELIQGDCTAPKLAAELALRLDDPDLRARQIGAQNLALDKLGRGGEPTADRAADAIIAVVRSHAGAHPD